MEQQNHGRDDAAPLPSPGIDPLGGGGNPPFDPHLLSQPDPNHLLPVMTANGSAPFQPQQKTVSAGKQTLLVTPKYPTAC